MPSSENAQSPENGPTVRYRLGSCSVRNCNGYGFPIRTCSQIFALAENLVRQPPHLGGNVKGKLKIGIMLAGAGPATHLQDYSAACLWGERNTQH